jgi:4-carboxymuconolactone decarboxylase
MRQPDMADYAPRIPPVAADALTDEQQKLVGKWSSMNFASVIVNSPELYKVLVPLIAKLIPGSALPPRDREILVLRTLGLCEETYEAHHHVMIARNAGMSDDEIEAARTGNTALPPSDQALMRAAEELHANQHVSDGTWRALAQRYSPEELMEVVALVGGYTLMAMVTKSYGIQPEDAETFDSFTKMRQYT